MFKNLKKIQDSITKRFSCCGANLKALLKPPTTQEILTVATVATEQQLSSRSHIVQFETVVALSKFFAILELRTRAQLDHHLHYINMIYLNDWISTIPKIPPVMGFELLKDAYLTLLAHIDELKPDSKRRLIYESMSVVERKERLKIYKLYLYELEFLLKITMKASFNVNEHAETDAELYRRLHPTNIQMYNGQVITMEQYEQFLNY